MRAHSTQTSPTRPQYHRLDVEDFQKGFSAAYVVVSQRLLIRSFLDQASRAGSDTKRYAVDKSHSPTGSGASSDVSLSDQHSEARRMYQSHLAYTVQTELVRELTHMFDKVWILEVVKQITSSPIFVWDDKNTRPNKVEILKWIAEFLRMITLSLPLS